MLVGLAWHDHGSAPVVYQAEAHEPEPEPEPREVRIEVVINWTEERIIEEIMKVFPEDPHTAVAIARCESGLRPDIRSRNILSYGQERSYGLMQIHAPDWHEKALELGYDDYQIDVQDNLHMARYIYESAGKRWTPWTCYTKKRI